MEPQEVGAYLGNAIGSFLAKLFGFKTFLTLFDAICTLAGGWIDSIVYRDAGERNLRGAIGSILQGAAIFVELWVFSALFGPTGPITPLLLLWGGTMRYADWASAMNRRKRERTEGYTFSYFIGYPRFLDPADPRSYIRQGGLVVLVGVLVCFLDPVGGPMLIVAGLSLLARQWVIRARWREEAMDSLDSEWEAEMRARAKVAAGGADLTIQDTQTAQVVSTADFVRHFSTR